MLMLVKEGYVVLQDVKNVAVLDVQSLGLAAC
jgi:hypothetical protein